MYGRNFKSKTKLKQSKYPFKKTDFYEKNKKEFRVIVEPFGHQKTNAPTLINSFKKESNFD